MTLVWPQTEEEVVLDAPRLHALVIGVGKYDHLGSNTDSPSTVLSGLPKLESTAPSAELFAKWLQERYKTARDSALGSLGSVELLLSPHGAAPTVDPATRNNVKSAYDRWYGRCNSNKGNIAVVYFAGHGFSRSARDYLLLQDFGADPAEVWENCIDGTALVEGMKKCKADTQLFFFDACRDYAFDALMYDDISTMRLGGAATLSDHVSHSMVYLAAKQGQKAWGNKKEKITYFCHVLLMCLNGVGGRIAGPGWAVDGSSLSMAMASVVSLLEKRESLGLSFDSTGASVDPIHRPEEGRVLLQVSNQTQQDVEIVVEPYGGDCVKKEPEKEFPWAIELPAGHAKIEAKCSKGANTSYERYLHPPVHEWTVPEWIVPQ